jgi:hypothetical protein
LHALRLFIAVDATMEKPVKKAKRAYRVTPEDSKRRSEQIRQHWPKGVAASRARPPEERSKSAAIGGRAYVQKYHEMKDALKNQTPEGYESLRKEHEATRERILKSIVERAEEPDAAPAIVSLALRELREEADRLRELEKTARLERANGVRPVTSSNLSPASPGIPATDISPADSAPVSPSLAAD